MAGEKQESTSGTSSTFEVNDSDFEVSDVEGEMEEQEPQLDAAAVAAAECVHEVPV